MWMGSSPTRDFLNLQLRDGSAEIFYQSALFCAVASGSCVSDAEVFGLSGKAGGREGTVEADQLIDPGMIHERDLLRVHTPQYIHSIRSGELNEVTRQKLGLPWSMELSRRSHCAVAGTLAAARAALVGGIACNLAGGTHHAFADRGEGFCVFNDVAIAIRTLQAEEPYLQVLVVDLDAHQGNGTHFIFKDDPRVFTYSVHVGRNYPSKKEAGDLDVELPRWVGGDEYLERLRSTLPGVLQRFEPDLVFYIAGVDVHADDRFGQMQLSTEEMEMRDRWTIDLIRDLNIPTVVLYGGGYNKVEEMTTELHCQTMRAAAARFAGELG